MIQLAEYLDLSIKIVQKLIVYRFVFDHLDRHQHRLVTVLRPVLALVNLAEEAFADLFIHRYSFVGQFVLFDGGVQQEKALQCTASSDNDDGRR